MKDHLSQLISGLLLKKIQISFKLRIDDGCKPTLLLLHGYILTNTDTLEEIELNGLKYIRTRCNLSSSELANILGITRQALSSWENEKKEIPEQRLKELEEYFGLERKYFGEISELDIEYILGKAMFRYDVNGKEAYRFKPEQDYDSYEWAEMYFERNREISLDEELALAKKKKQETIEKIEDIIKWSDSPYRVDQINLTRRNCEIYGMINDLMEHLRKTNNRLKVPFFYELKNVWKAMLLAYGLLDTSELEYRESKERCGEDGEWIIELADILKNHWSEESVYQLEREIKRKEKRELDRKNGNIIQKKPQKTVAEQRKMHI